MVTQKPPRALQSESSVVAASLLSVQYGQPHGGTPIHFLSQRLAVTDTKVQRTSLLSTFAEVKRQDGGTPNPIETQMCRGRLQIESCTHVQTPTKQAIINHTFAALRDGKGVGWFQPTKSQ
jgi:hypothetical protein